MAYVASREARSFLRSLAAITLGLGLAIGGGCQRGQSAKSKDNASSATAAAKQPSADDGAKPATGRKILERMIATYRKASSYADNGVVHMVAEADGKKLRDVTEKFSFAIERPNKVRVEAYGASLVCDGKRLFAAVNDLPGQVLLTNAPPRLTLRSVFRDWALTRAMTQSFAGAMPQVMLALAEKPMEALTQGGDEPVLAESGDIEGHECYRVKVNRDTVGSTTFWIDQQTFLLRRVVLPTDELRNMLSQEQPIDTLSVVADFPGAAIDVKVDPTAFAFEAPKDAKTVDYLIPPHMGQLLKNKAPQFEFHDLAGKPVTSETMAGKITVLNFWSIGFDCKQNLQDLEQVFQRYKNNPRVAIYAVCLDPPQLKNSDVTQAMQDLKVHVPLLRDPKQAAAAFKLAEPPSTFILDDKGIVQHCEGVTRELAKTLPQRLDKALAGGDISAEAQKQYQDQLNFLGQYAKLADQPEEPAESGKTTATKEVPLPEAKIGQRTQPSRLKLTPLWRCTELKSPGNIVVLSGGAGARLLVTDEWTSLAEVGLDGKVIARHKPDLAPQEVIGCLRTASGADGHRYVVAFFWQQQRCHVFDENWKPVAHYPADALQHPHSGITDVQFGDLDGSGQLRLFLSYAGVVGVQSATLDGKRLWSNRAAANVSSLAVGTRHKNGPRELLCATGGETLTGIDARGASHGEIGVSGRQLRRIAAADLRGEGQSLWCGIAPIALGRDVAVGFSLAGEELWQYPLPEGVAPQPIEPIITGRVLRDGPSQWLLPGPDGSIHIIAADGTPIDKFNYGEALQGLATVDIGGRPTLVVATAKGLEAWSMDLGPAR
ncbi:MAG: redoxin domain-containing protein [Planctomycetaceae bacterium]|nr:redoxin domain-containing protein [Planctomycetaceae bacterium]